MRRRAVLRWRPRPHRPHWASRPGPARSHPARHASLPVAGDPAEAAHPPAPSMLRDRGMGRRTAARGGRGARRRRAAQAPRRCPARGAGADGPGVDGQGGHDAVPSVGRRRSPHRPAVGGPGPPGYRSWSGRPRTRWSCSASRCPVPRGRRGGVPRPQGRSRHHRRVGGARRVLREGATSSTRSPTSGAPRAQRGARPRSRGARQRRVALPLHLGGARAAGRATRSTSPSRSARST